MKRILSLIITAVMLTSLFGLSAAAEEPAVPHVSIDTLTDGETYARDELAAVEFSAEDSEGGAVAQLVINVDFAEFAVLTEAPYLADLSGLDSGRHYLEAVATDANGATASAMIRFVVKPDSSMVGIYEYDFSEYVSEGTTAFTNASVQFGTASSTNRGDALIKSVSDADKYGEEHGVIAEITGSGTEYDEAAKRFLNNGAYFQIGINSAYAAAPVTMEFDMWIENVPQQFGMGVRDTAASSVSTDITVLPTGIKFAGDSANSISDIDWSQPEYTGWYHFVYSLNAATRLYSCTVTREGETEPFAQTVNSKMARQAIQGAQGFRFTISVNNEGQSSLTAFDNFKMSVAVGDTVITDITADTAFSDGAIAPENSSVAVALSNALNPATVTADTVKVYIGDRQVVTDSVTFDGNLVITFGEKLAPSQVYRVELSDAVADGMGNALDGGRCSFFITSYAANDAVDLSLAADENGSYVTGTMIDREGVNDELYIIVTVWNGDRMTDISVTPVTWSNGSVFNTGYVTAADGETVSFAIWDSLAIPNVLLKDITK